MLLLHLCVSKIIKTILTPVHSKECITSCQCIPLSSRCFFVVSSVCLTFFLKPFFFGAFLRCNAPYKTTVLAAFFICNLSTSMSVHKHCINIIETRTVPTTIAGSELYRTLHWCDQAFANDLDQLNSWPYLCDEHYVTVALILKPWRSPRTATSFMMNTRGKYCIDLGRSYWSHVTVTSREKVWFNGTGVEATLKPLPGRFTV